jgi:hypothetical protein
MLLTRIAGLWALAGGEKRELGSGVERREMEGKETDVWAIVLGDIRPFRSSTKYYSSKCLF